MWFKSTAGDTNGGSRAPREDGKRELPISRRAAFAGLGLLLTAPWFGRMFSELAYADTFGGTYEMVDLQVGRWYPNLDRRIGTVPFKMQFILDTKTMNPDGSYTCQMRFDKTVYKPWDTDGVDRVWYMAHTYMKADNADICNFGPGQGQEVPDWGSIRHESPRCTVHFPANHSTHITNTQTRYGMPGIHVVGEARFDFYVHVVARHTVTFKAGYGNNAVLKTETVNHGGNATAPANPTRTGYDFIGWDRGFTNVTSDITVTAQWRIKTYTVTFKAGYGNNATLKTEKVNHGGAATAPKPPVRDSHTFIGWDKRFDNVTGNLTVTATWKIKTYTVTFKSGFGDNAVLKTEKVNHGGAAHAPSVPSRTGYTHTGWDKRFDTITSNLTVTATWRAHTYRIVFHANGRGSSGETPAMDMAYDVAKTLTRNGFERHEDVGSGRIQHWRFLGWSRTEDGGVDFEDEARVINLTAEDKATFDLYAVWEKINGWGDGDKEAEHDEWL